MLTKVTSSKYKPLILKKVWYWGKVEFATTQLTQKPASTGLTKVLSRPIEVTLKVNPKIFFATY